jgi:hypothetical protein
MIKWGSVLRPKMRKNEYAHSLEAVKALEEVIHIMTRRGER